MSKKTSVKFGWKFYFNPTPKRMKQLGDYLLWIFGVITTSAIFMNYRFIALIALFCGIIGKALTTFTTYK